MIRGVLFDLDGVIVDTLHYHYLAWKHMFGKYGGTPVSEHSVLLHEGRLLGATMTLKRAIELDPQDAHAHHCLGIALARTGDLEGARAELATLETLDPARAERLRQELPAA